MSNEFVQRDPSSASSNTSAPVTTSLVDDSSHSPSPWWSTPASEYRAPAAVDPAIFALDAYEVGHLPASLLGPPVGIRKADTSANAPHSRSPEQAVDSAVDSINGEIDRATKNAPKADEATHHQGLVGRIMSVPPTVLKFIEDGHRFGIERLQPEPAPESTAWASMLAFAAAMAVGGVAGAAAQMIGGDVASALFAKVTPVKAKFVENAIKEAVKRGLKSEASSAGQVGYRDLKMAFDAQLTDQRAVALIELNEEFSRLYDQLSMLSTSELEMLADTLTDRLTQHHKTLMNSVIDKTVVAWTNFIAQVKHGAMGEWDLWERNGSKGAIALEGATPKPGDAQGAQAATSSNIDPRAASSLRAAGDHEHHGILEIATTPNGALLEDGRGMYYGHGYGMRLENVGPLVRERIRTLGTVRDVPLNKMVRVYKLYERGVEPVGSILITADGHVRQYDLAPSVHPDPRPYSLGEQLGLEHRAPRVDQTKTELRVADVAERVQSLSLSNLEA